MGLYCYLHVLQPPYPESRMAISEIIKVEMKSCSMGHKFPISPAGGTGGGREEGERPQGLTVSSQCHYTQERRRLSRKL